MEYKRGEIYLADLGANNTGSEQSGTRPVLIVQNNIGNRYSPTVIVACITSKIYRNEIPTHVKINCLEVPSLILCEQIKTIDKSRLKNKLADLDFNDQAQVNSALQLSLALQ